MFLVCNMNQELQKDGDETDIYEKISIDRKNPKTSIIKNFL